MYVWGIRPPRQAKPSGTASEYKWWRQRHGQGRGRDEPYKSSLDGEPRDMGRRPTKLMQNVSVTYELLWHQLFVMRQKIHVPVKYSCHLLFLAASMWRWRKTTHRRAISQPTQFDLHFKVSYLKYSGPNKVTLFFG